MTHFKPVHKLRSWISFLIMGLVGLMVVSLYGIALYMNPKEKPYHFVHAAAQENRAKRAALQPRAAKQSFISAETMRELKEMFAQENYSLRLTSEGRVQVPRLYLTKLPGDFHRNASPRSRQDMFVQALLPMILDANHAILAERTYMSRLKDRVDQNLALTFDEETWVRNLGQQYKVTHKHLPTLLKMLLKRVDVVPISLALAQAIEESGWGTSSAARIKNSTFGVTLASGVKRYDNLYINVRRYIHNLNSNPAYADMRQIRYEMRERGERLCSEKMVHGLHRYSELRHVYTSKIQRIIRQYDLKKYDTAQFQYL